VGPWRKPSLNTWSARESAPTWLRRCAASTKKDCSASPGHGARGRNSAPRNWRLVARLEPSQTSRKPSVGGRERMVRYLAASSQGGLNGLDSYCVHSDGHRDGSRRLLLHEARKVITAFEAASLGSLSTDPRTWSAMRHNPRFDSQSWCPFGHLTN